MPDSAPDPTPDPGSATPPDSHRSSRRASRSGGAPSRGWPYILLTLVLLGGLWAVLGPGWKGARSTPGEGPQTLERLLQSVVQIQGGPEILRSIGSLRCLGTLTLGGETYDFTLLKKRPQFIRITYQLPDLRVSTGWDGQVAWREEESSRKFLRATGVLDGAERDALIRDARFDNPLIRLDGNLDGLRYLGRFSYDGRSYHRIEVTTPGLAQPEYVLLDPDTYHDTIHLQTDPATGQPLEIRFSDFRALPSGLVLPFLIERRRAGQVEWTIRIARIETNLGLPDSIFTKPEVEI